MVISSSNENTAEVYNEFEMYKIHNQFNGKERDMKFIYHYFRIGVESIAQLVGFTPDDLYGLLHSRPQFHWWRKEGVGGRGEREGEQ